MGAGRPGGYVYSSIPFIAIFGPGALGVRMLSILSGLGIIGLVYLLGKRLFSQNIGLIGAGLTAISPWAINLSRAGFEANYALLLALIGVLLFLSAKDKAILYIISVFFFGLTIFTYPTYKMILPIFAVPLVLYTGGIKQLFVKSRRLFVIIALMLGLVFAGLSLNETISNSSEERFSNINIFSDEEVKRLITEKVNVERGMVGVSFVDRLFHNKVVEYINVYGKNYLSNFSFDYLFLEGDGNPRHNMTQTGVLFSVEVISILLGLVILAKKESRKMWFLGGWILIVPLATALIGVPHTLRNAFMLPVLTLISAYGISFLLDQKRKAIYIILLVVLGIQFIFQFERIILISPKVYEKSWSLPAKTASQIAINEKDNYDFVILSDAIDSIEYAYSVYAKIDSKDIQKENSRQSKVGKYNFKNFENVYIGRIPKNEIASFISELPGSTLFIGSDAEIVSGETVKFLDPFLNLSVVRKEQ
jgi:4-amino-4-deoxy-L-arabinose transferase-like glycosyltransferase